MPRGWGNSTKRSRARSASPLTPAAPIALSAPDSGAETASRPETPAVESPTLPCAQCASRRSKLVANRRDMDAMMVRIRELEQKLSHALHRAEAAEARAEHKIESEVELRRAAERRAKCWKKKYVDETRADYSPSESEESDDVLSESSDAAAAVTEEEEDVGDAKAKLHSLGVATAESVTAVIGDAQSTYLHDMVYKWPHLGPRVGHLLRLSMEGFEHGNKVFAQTIRNECSHGGRVVASGPKAGTRYHVVQQALSKRRACTVAVQELGLVNQTSRMQSVLVPSEMYERRKYTPQEALVELSKLKQELDDRIAARCESCDPE